MKKIVTFLVALIMILTASASLVACGKPIEPDDPSQKTVKVKAYLAGYGIEWLKSGIEKFNQVYKKDGYAVKIEDAKNSISGEAISLEIKDVAKNDVDIYFGSGVSIPTLIESSPSVMRDGGVLLEDLSSVYGSKAIKFDGKEESVTIESKLNSSVRKHYQYNDTASSFSGLVGKYYSFPWASGVAGLFVNKNVLSANGFEIPRTTDEMFAHYQKLKPNQVSSNVYPMAFGGLDAQGYWLYMYDTLFAQYSGYEAENRFWNISTESNGYEIYQDQGILEALKVIEKVADDNYAINGSNRLGKQVAQANLVKGNALYMCTGNWTYNEMKLDNPSEVNNIQVIKMPIISALGTKLGITDAVLSNIVKGIDNGADDQTITAENSVSADVVKAVRDARNVYFNASVDHMAIIPSYSEEKDVAKLFLRFMASDEFLDVYREKTNSALPFNYATSSKYSPNDYEKSVDAVCGGRNAVMLSEDLYTSPIRRKAHLQCFGDTGYATVFKNIAMKTETGTSVFNATFNYVKDNWQALLSQI